MIAVWLTVSCLAAGLTVTRSDLDSDIAREETQLSLPILPRSRRYVVFPEGSTFNAAFCITIKSTTGPDPIFTEGVNWAVSYDLPNETIRERDSRYEFPVIIRRHKRDLYTKMEKLMDSVGIDGRECVLRTICETGQQLAPRQGILEEIFRLLFTNPRENGSGQPDSKIHWIYREAYEKGIHNENCNDLYDCPISILDLGLGFGQFHHSSSSHH